MHAFSFPLFLLSVVVVVLFIVLVMIATKLFLLNSLEIKQC